MAYGPVPSSRGRGPASPGGRPPGTPRWPTAPFLRHGAGALPARGGDPLEPPDGPGQLTAPRSCRSVISAGVRPRPASTSLVLLPGRTGGDGWPLGVRPNRGAGAGWMTPPTSMNVPRAALCGWAGASPGLTTGATQASEPAKAAT